MDQTHPISMNLAPQRKVSMKKITSFKLLSFDVYGTLIDYDRGLLEKRKPTKLSSKISKVKAAW